VRGRAELVDVADAVARQVVRIGGERKGHAHLRLLATARPERLHAALAPLGLGWLAGRATGASLVSA
jgi:glutamate racemase